MTTVSENEILTRVGPGTPMGRLMREYWLPAAMSSELEADGDPLRLMLLGEKLIAFRDSSGRVGIMDHRCPHRCASLFFGRNEEGGIRCVYHGWKFDAEGNCLEMPNVPPHQDFRHKVRAKAYKTAEQNGIVYVFMGDRAEAPPLPRIDMITLPEDEVDIRFVLRECNWLQGVEGELDTSHVGFLHFGKVNSQAFEAEDTQGYTVVNRTPEYQTRETDYGYMYCAYRPGDEVNTYWRFAHYLFPVWTMPPILPFARNVLTRAYVPVDDEHTMIVTVTRKGAYPERMADRQERLPGASQNYPYLPRTTDWLGRFRLKLNLDNDFGIDREAQRTRSFTGIEGVQMQDQAVQISMGPIAERDWEHLAPSDVMITRVRRMMLRAVTALAKEGKTPPGVDSPELYANVRGGNFLTPKGRDWLEVYAEQLAASPVFPGAREAAE